MQKIVISSCLLGEPCRYDGKKAKLEVRKKIERILPLLEKEFHIISICPEVLGGLSTPRVPAEIIGNRVVNREGNDVTEFYYGGAVKVLEIAKDENVKMAILKERSPSCGSNEIYDGSFEGILIKGEGVTAKILRENKIEVFSEEEIEEVEKIIRMKNKE